MNQEELLLDLTATQANKLCNTEIELNESSMITLSNILRMVEHASICGRNKMVIKIEDINAKGLLQKLRKLEYDVEIIEIRMDTFAAKMDTFTVKLSWKKEENIQQENKLIKRLDILEKIVQQIYYAPDMPGAILAQIEFIKQNENETK